MKELMGHVACSLCLYREHTLIPLTALILLLALILVSWRDTQFGHDYLPAGLAYNKARS